MPAHTPGPWSFPPWSSVVGSGVFAQPDPGRNTKMLAQVRSSVADARLMAAAPDMLTACKMALRALEFDLTGDGKRDLAKLLTETIALAEVES